MNFETIIKKIMEDPKLAASFLSPLIDHYMPLLCMAEDELLKIGIQLQENYVNSGYALASAKARKAKFDAYMEAGFTSDQAMSLLLTDIRHIATIASGASSKAASGVAEGVCNA